MTRAGDAPEGGTSYRYANPSYPQEGIKLPPVEVPDGPTLQERLAEKHALHHINGGRCWWGCPMNKPGGIGDN